MAEAPRTWPCQSLLGVSVHALNQGEVLDIIDQAIADRKQLLIGVVNAAKLVNMRRDAALDSAVRQADLTLADGMSVVWASRLLRRSLPERVTGIDLMTAMLARGAQRGYRIYCLGATQDVLDETVRRINEEYPGVVVCGQRNGYFDSSEERAVADAIADARPDILLAAMSSPKKELFLAKWRTHLNVPVCHGVGGAFDVMAGKAVRAPVVWQRLGMEWLYRLLQEPRRLWRRYLVTNTLFCGMVLSEMTGRNKTGT